jgi:hypothetical protein
MINDKNSLNKIVGTRELRAKLSSFLDSVINNGTEITTGHIKKKNSETASILPTQILIAMLKDAYAFNLIIEFDKETQQYSAGIDELKIYTVSDTIENVKADIVDLVIDATDEYFQNIGLYIKIPDYKKMYPYFLLIRHCTSTNEVINLINAN